MPHEKQFDWEGFGQADILIQASMAFPKLEDLVFNADTEILLAFRVFDAETKLRSKHKSPSLHTWADLIALKVRQGVQVKLLLADFEPILTPKLHEASWTSGATFLKAMEGSDNFQLVCTQHPAQFSPIMQAVFWPWFLKKLFGLKRDVKTGEIDLKNAPGLRPYYTLDGQIKKRALFKPAPMRPVTYHHKLAVIDGETAIVGGLDLDERRYDTGSHERPAKDTWHDISVMVQGRVADDLRSHFVICWNMECGREEQISRLRRLTDDNQISAMPAQRMSDVSPKTQKEESSRKARVIRTLSRNANGLFAIRPKNHCDEIFQETQAIISECKHTLYIETQFFRSIALAKALARQAGSQPDLTCIILLPFAPEEIAFDKHDHPAHRHGEWLQGRCLKILKKAFGERLGIFSLAKPEPAKSETGRAKEYGAGVIHLHSKLLMADDQKATITSANLNGRSLKWDTEVGVSFDDADFTRSSRVALWQQHLQVTDVDTWTQEEGLRRWKDIALGNVTLQPSERQGFVLPHKSAKTIRYGRPAIIIPDEMV